MSYITLWYPHFCSNLEAMTTGCMFYFSNSKCSFCFWQFSHSRFVKDFILRTEIEQRSFYVTLTTTASDKWSTLVDNARWQSVRPAALNFFNSDFTSPRFILNYGGRWFPMSCRVVPLRHRSDYDRVLFLTSPNTFLRYEPRTCGLQA